MIKNLTGKIAPVFRSAFTRVAARSPELVELAGLSFVAYGVSLIYIPAGFIAFGLLLTFLGYVGGSE